MALGAALIVAMRVASCSWRGTSTVEFQEHFVEVPEDAWGQTAMEELRLRVADAEVVANIPECTHDTVVKQMRDLLAHDWVAQGDTLAVLPPVPPSDTALVLAQKEFVMQVGAPGDLDRVDLEEDDDWKEPALAGTGPDAQPDVPWCESVEVQESGMLSLMPVIPAGSCFIVEHTGIIGPRKTPPTDAIQPGSVWQMTVLESGIRSVLWQMVRKLGQRSVHILAHATSLDEKDDIMN